MTTYNLMRAPLFKAAALALFIAAPGSLAAADTPKVTDIIFEVQHIAALEKGAELVYHFERKPSDTATMGEAFKDDIKLKIVDAVADGKKNIELQIYSGEHARDLQKIDGLSINPVFVVGIDAAVASFRIIGGGDRSYLKNAFSKALQETAKVEPVKVDYKGSQVDGFKITVVPYTNDPSKAKMRGFEGSTFTFVVSDKVPGHFAKMIASYVNREKNAPSLEETTTLDGVGEVK
jgi:hypothetical protein